MAVLKSRVAIVLSVVLLTTFAGRWLDVRALSGDIKGDEATYIAMALSLADDGDLYYEREDYERFVALYGEGPGGIFLKKRYTLGVDGKTDVPTDQSLAFGKALIYPAAAAPFAFVGSVGGLVVFNWLMVLSCVWFGLRFSRAASGQRYGWVYGVAFIGASVVPVFATFLTSEIFNFALIFWAYYLWLYKKVAPSTTHGWLMHPTTTIIAAVLVGLATFSKPTNAALVGPIVLDLLVQRRLAHSVIASVAFVAGVAGLFGINALITGEASYQGAGDGVSRRSFQDAYPFDEAGTRFEVQGNAMVTNDADTGRVLSEGIVSQIPLNVAYFFVGRHAGLVPYYLPGVVIVLCWIASARRAPLWQWTSFLAVVGSIATLIVLLPDSWNGGGGPPGNRYFLSMYPPLLFLLPRGVSLWPGIVSLAGGLAFVGHMLASPYQASATPWINVERRPLKWLPIEVTLFLDLPFRLNTLRGPILFVQEPTVQVAYMDANTYSAEGQGFWIAGGDTAETIVRTERPLRRVDLTFSAPIENTVTGTFADRSIDVSVREGSDASVQIARPEPGRYLHSYTYILKLTTTNGFVPSERDPSSNDTRNLGVFVKLAFAYDEPAGAPTGRVSTDSTR
jgi:hypothetical protein